MFLVRCFTDHKNIKYGIKQRYFIRLQRRITFGLTFVGGCGCMENYAARMMQKNRAKYLARIATEIGHIK